MGAPELLALVLFAALVLYALSGGADFGGGTWDLLARGPRAGDQRRLIERALAPIWEANHVWLIVAVVLLFTAFPPAFAALTTRLHTPLTALLVGIVLRGSAFVFRQYGGSRGASGWERLFAVASAASPFFLGVVAGAVLVDGAGRPMGWASPLPLACGALAVPLCAFLAAVYLTVEASTQGRQDLAEDFRRRALAATAAVGVAAIAAAVAALADAPDFARRLFGSWWSAPVIATAALAAGGAVVALVRRRFRVARALAIVQVATLLVGWGAGHAPMLIAPDVTVRSAAAPAATLEVLGPVLLVGAILVFPSLFWLMRVFKARPPGS